MQLPLVLSAVLAPAVVSALAWPGPAPTLIAPEADNWSPAPTQAPIFDKLIELIKRQTIGDNTCGYVSGSWSQSLTCNNGDYVCATNTVNGVHGCCDPASMSDCVIPTACIPSASLSTCTGSCLTNQFIQKCTNPTYPYCYTWYYVYANPSTVMEEYGCYTSPLSLTILRTATSTPSSFFTTPRTTRSSTPSSSPISTPSSTIGSSTTTSASSSSQSTGPTSEAAKSSTNVGAIAGGVVGGLAVLGAAAAGVVYMILRSRKKKNEGTPPAAPMVQPEYKPVPPGPGPHDPAYAQTQYGQPPYGDPAYMQQQQQMGQPGNTMSYYMAPGQDVKHNYAVGQQMQTPTAEFAGASAQPGHGAYSPPHSPAPQYSQMQPQSINGQMMVPAPHNGAMQLDSTPIPGHPGQQIYEAPSGRE